MPKKIRDLRRLQLIQAIFEVSNFRTYLEIGCYQGKTFFPIKAKRKIAVDPFFHPVFIKNALMSIFKSTRNINHRYFNETSDRFFLKRQSFLRRVAPLDVVFIDGLHTFEAALKDVLNSLKFLNPNGVIIMHDCYPPNKAAALPTKRFPTPEDLKGIEGWTGAWNGDVWKAIVYLNRHFADVLDVCVIDTDNGLGVIRLKQDIGKKDLTIAKNAFVSIDALTYDDLIKNTASFLNLLPSEHVTRILDEIAISKVA